VQNSELGRVSLDITSSNTKNSVEIKNGEIVFNSDIKLKLTVSETEKGIKNPLSENDYKVIKHSCEQKTKTLCKETAEKCFSKKSDVFMCARYLYMKDKNLYDSLKSSWRDELGSIKVNISVKAELQRINNNTV